MCLSEETVRAVGPFYLVSMPGEVKDPMQGNGKNLWWTHWLTLEKDTLQNQEDHIGNKCTLVCVILGITGYQKNKQQQRLIKAGADMFIGGPTNTR